ncbi:Uncharacterized conserved protein YybS, DUF2232 family [Evansella caseinilytica]|uniref:Uncharacterized conserved protein YybS, DUF2232 family n=1 Tax=Evansella caseinilytica TaxID=1503961 RepID=A0A1H3UTV7_9BACI|nr:YybS family protein [Evansella caseinilytica]SDZ65275.1 Uncharacterized conserved protein YybS, DUF2232 family [Evansella caseinilytica]
MDKEEETREERMDRSQVIKDGVIYTAVYLLLLFLTLLLPAVGMLTMLLLPVPFILFTTKHGYKAGIVIVLTGFFLLFLFFGPISLPLTLSFVAPGIVIGELHKRKKSAFGVLLGGGLSFVTVIILNYIGSIVLRGINPVQVLQDAVRESVQKTGEILQMFGQQSDDVLELTYAFIDELAIIAPVLMMILGIGYAFLVQLIAGAFMTRTKQDIHTFPPLRTWSFPKAFVWYYAATYILVLIGPEAGTALYTVLANLRPILEIIMIIQGFAFIFFFFYTRGKNIAIPVIIMIVSILLPFLLHIVRIFGIIDLGFDLRKRLNSQN